MTPSPPRTSGTRPPTSVSAVGPLGDDARAATAGDISNLERRITQGRGQLDVALATPDPPERLRWLLAGLQTFETAIRELAHIVRDRAPELGEPRPGAPDAASPPPRAVNE